MVEGGNASTILNVKLCLRLFVAFIDLYWFVGGINKFHIKMTKKKTFICHV